MFHLRSCFEALKPHHRNQQTASNTTELIESPFVKVLENKPDLFVPVMQEYLSDPLASSETVDLFIRHGKAKVNEKNQEGMPFLIAALDKNHPRAFKQLLKHPEIQLNPSDRRGRTPFLAAVIQGNLPVVQHLANKLGVKPDANSPEGKAALRWAIRRGDFNMLGHLLNLWKEQLSPQKKADMKLQCRTHQDRVNRLARKRPESKEGMAQAIMDSLKKYAVIPSAVENTVIYHQAAGYDLNARTAQGFTPLTLAAILGSPEAVQTLLMTGVDLDQPLKNGQTALMTAILCRKAEVAKKLIDAGANVTHQDENGNTALFYLFGSPRDQRLSPMPELATMLIGEGASVNHRNKRGETPLHHAARYGRADALETIRFLQAAGADARIKDNAGCTPLKLAKSAKAEPVILQILQG